MDSKKTIVVMPQMLITEELVELADNAIKSFRKNDVFLISIDDAGEYPKAKGALEVMAKSDLVLTNKINQGFGITCNRGFNWIFENEKNDCWIIISNNDLEIEDNSIKELQRPFGMFENVAITGICSTTEREIEGKKLKDYHEDKMTMDGFISCGGGHMQDGALICTKKSVLEKIGIYDEDFKGGGQEDIDLFLRARDQFGMKIVMSGFGWYWHKQGATRWNSAMKDKYKAIEEENREKLTAKLGYNPQNRQVFRETQIFNA
jgi:GT2 family glycosyltransferase